jgi:hypothetical protein
LWPGRVDDTNIAIQKGKLFSLAIEYLCSILSLIHLFLVGLGKNEKDSPTVDFTVLPLSGAITASPLLNSDGGAKEKTSGNLGDFTLFN